MSRRRIGWFAASGLFLLILIAGFASGASSAITDHRVKGSIQAGVELIPQSPAEQLLGFGSALALIVIGLFVLVIRLAYQRDRLRQQLRELGRTPRA